MMTLLMNGTSISTVEVTNISTHGFWLLSRDKEYFLPFNDFPWFKDKTVRSITNVVEESKNHLYWPDLDVDLSYDLIQNPHKYPLKSKLQR